MARNQDDIVREVPAKGLTAPRVTADMVEDEIVGVEFHIFDDTCMTVCCLTLRNGFAVIGASSSVSPENFNQELGEKIAYGRACDAIWPLLAFRLRDELACETP